MVVITGPIAAGKSAVAKELAISLKQDHRTAVVVDLDEVVATIHAPPERTGQVWSMVRAVHGHLVGEWLTSAVDVVIVDGPFYSTAETSTMMRGVPEGVRPLRVLLMASFKVALDRVAMDPSRGISKIPSVLRTLYDEFESQLPNVEQCDLTFDSSATTVEEIVHAVRQKLLLDKP